MDFVRIGIIGIGNMGRAHGVRLFKGEVPHMRLGAVCDIDADAREWCKTNLPGVPVYPSAEEMMAGGEIDAILVAVPHYDHAKYTIMGFEKGFHVYCEKPAGVYTLQVQDMIEASKKRPDLVFSSGFQQRTWPCFQKLREMIQGGELGHIKKVVWIVTNWYRSQCYHDSCDWRSTWKGEGGGTLVNQNPHNLDMWQWLFGMPDQVMSTVDYGKYYDIEVDDDFTIMFRYNNGTVGIYTTSTGECPGTNRLEISADMGKVVLEDGKITFWKNAVSEREFNKTNTSPFGRAPSEKIEIELPKQEMQEHNTLLENFAMAIMTGSPLLAPGVDGINEVLLADSVYYSDWQGQVWISPKDFDHEGFYAALKAKADASTATKTVRKAEVDMGASYQK